MPTARRLRVLRIMMNTLWLSQDRESGIPRKILTPAADVLGHQLFDMALTEDNILVVTEIVRCSIDLGVKRLLKW